MRRYFGYVWQTLSFLLVLYGFYLFFLFMLDTLIRINKSLALPISLVITLLLLTFVLVFWYRKKRLPF